MSSSSSSMRFRVNRANNHGFPNVRSREGSTTRCRCGETARLYTSWTSRNPGRKFLSCPNYQDPSRDCNYFQWVDPELEDNWYRSTMYDLRTEVMRCEREKEDNLQLLKKSKKDLMKMKILSSC